MIIRSIELHNFRVFKYTKIDFAYEGESGRNITIILGQNTYGKTTLVKSFVWCLYTINLFNDKILLNKEVANSLRIGEEAKASVILEIEHSNAIYRIKTTDTYRKSNSGSISAITKNVQSVSKIVNGIGHPVPESQIIQTINGILRPELKDYFFFDGESNQIESITTRSNLKAAVRDMLNLNRIDMLRDYYDPSKNESVTSYIRTELTSKSSVDLGASELEDQLKEEQNNLDRLKKDEEEYTKQLNELEGQKAEYDKKLEDNADITDRVRQRQKAELLIENGHKNIPDLFNDLISMLNKQNILGKVFFASSFKKYDLGEKFKHTTFTSQKSFTGIKEDAVDHIIKNGVCICGAVVVEGNDAYNHLIEARTHMEPHDYSTYVSDFVGNETANLYYANNIRNDIRSCAKKITDTIREVDDSKEQLKEINTLLRGRVDVGQVQANLDEVKTAIGNITGRLEMVSASIPDSEDKIRNIKEKQLKYVKKSKETDNLTSCYNYAQRIFKAADNMIKTSNSEIKGDLLESVQNIFNQLYSGKREITMDDNYSVKVVPETDTSTGFKIVLNFSFVIGLMNLAKKSAAKYSGGFADEEIEPEEYPLVLDAPLSTTDDTHITNIARALANNCDQVIMVLMEKDFRYAQKTISDKIGKTYKLDKISEYESRVVEED